MTVLASRKRPIDSQKRSIASGGHRRSVPIETQRNSCPVSNLSARVTFHPRFKNKLHAQQLAIPSGSGCQCAAPWPSGAGRLTEGGGAGAAGRRCPVTVSLSFSLCAGSPSLGYHSPFVTRMSLRALVRVGPCVSQVRWRMSHNDRDSSISDSDRDSSITNLKIDLIVSPRRLLPRLNPELDPGLLHC